MKHISLCVAFLGLFGVAGCSLSPDYAPPALKEPIPQRFKEVGLWHEGTPMDSLDRGNWWERFQDPALNALIEKANGANQNIAVAAASFRQARTQIATARSAFIPGVSVPASALKSGQVDGGSSSGKYSVGVNAAWEVSLWNSIPAFEAAKATTEQSAADYATMRLAIQAELAQTYFRLRALDGQLELYETTIAAYVKAVQLTRSQYKGGITTPADVAQAEAQLASAEGDMAGLERQRALYEHALATLTGQMATTFSLERQPLSATMPQLPPMVPSVLLERRPDIASAERNVAWANEQIGIARGAWFPTLSLGGGITGEHAGWHSVPVTLWSLGPSMALDVFNGGKRLAANEASWAQYEGTVASYRQTVLVAFQEVEDQLVSLRHLDTEVEARVRAAMASKSALRLSLSQYTNGLTTYLQVVSNQTASLTSERSAMQAQADRLVSAVALIKALGGGWDPTSMQAMRKGVGVPQEGVIP